MQQDDYHDDYHDDYDTEGCVLRGCAVLCAICGIVGCIGTSIGALRLTGILPPPDEADQVLRDFLLSLLVVVVCVILFVGAVRAD
jgi:hypothetical protein